MPILLYLLIPVVALFVGAFAYDLNRRRRRSSGHDIDSGGRRRGPSHTWRSLKLVGLAAWLTPGVLVMLMLGWGCSGDTRRNPPSTESHP
jgi:ABC-type Fe3+ transport system permease subunit